MGVLILTKFYFIARKILSKCFHLDFLLIEIVRIIFIIVEIILIIMIDIAKYI